MTNANAPSFPLQPNAVTRGLTKKETFVLHLVAAMTTSPRHNTYDANYIAQLAIVQANAIFSELEKEKQTEKL